ncbi:acyl carrier protein [Streptomyces sp. TRM 70361]|uniref:acyl carrier protein n=1 Tax=Streptomyces sp. TRM 70361 TaxID=3116553 RepID=UPI002E7C4D23|nr:acyl carrier protein [Streptomyces sp. TRM 70361]MEE1938033.1 acyl carrier protein [Streptomyces sp. TRM 70361]
MSTEDTRQRVIGYMVERLGLEPDEITDTTRFREDLELDSLDMVELATILDEELGTQLDDSALESLATLGDVVAFAESRGTPDRSPA